MKTVRFASLVEACGKPEAHLVLVAPAKDRALQAAVKAGRVLTVFQATVGTKADRAEIGFKPGAGRQFWVFPKSLRRFEGRQVVGIKYDLLEAGKVRPEKAVKKARKEKQPKAPAEKPAPRKVIAFKPAREEPVPKDDGAEEAYEELEEMKVQVRKAMGLLEEGKQVAAFNVLKRLVEG